MGENLDAPGRHAVRTPMQWSPEANGGFSDADPGDLVAAVVDGGYAPQHVNVQDQRSDPDSLLSTFGLLARRYRECPELGWGSFTVLEQPHAAVLAHRCDWESATLVALHNLGSEPCTGPLALDGVPDDAQLVDLLADGTTALEGGRGELDLEGYGYRWLRLVRPGDRRLR